MGDDPFFSVVIPTYNRADLIGKTLDSVFAQTYPNYEVIVVDNCSTDRTVSVLQPLVDGGRIRLIRHAQNHERARSRNSGMAAARGRFLTLLDSDDLMYPGNLADAHEYVVGHPDARIFHNLFELVNGLGKTVKRYRFKPLWDSRRELANGNFLSCIGVFLHREVYQAFRFNEAPELTGSEDYELWLRVLARYPAVGRIPRINSGIVDHQNRTVHRFDVVAMERRMAAIVEGVRSDPAARAAYAAHMPRLMACNALYEASSANSNRQPLLAMRYVKDALRQDPTVALSLKFLRILQLLLRDLASRR